MIIESTAVNVYTRYLRVAVLHQDVVKQKKYLWYVALSVNGFNPRKKEKIRVSSLDFHCFYSGTPTRFEEAEI